MEGLLARLKRGEVLVGDGAWGTQLMLRGLPPGEPPEWFALEKPETIEEVARLYVEAGADLVTTDTFGGTSFRLELHGLGGEGDRINRQAVEAVKRAVAGRALVSASVGPSGQLLEPYGDTPPDAVEAAFAEQIVSLASAGADVLCIETMGDLTEATRAVKAAKSVAPGVPVMATMTFEPTPRGYFRCPDSSTASSTTSADETRSLARLRSRPSRWPPPLEIRPARRSQAKRNGRRVGP